MLLSLIIPAYNCEKTLNKAVFSVTGQNFDDIEIIIVDDGSTDLTPEIINSIAEKHLNVVSKRIDNSGPAFARNNGLEIAGGEYIMFLDSDDDFKDGSLKIIENALSSKPDILIFGFSQNFEGKAKNKIYSPDSDFSIDRLYKNNLLNSVWNKAYKRSFLIKNNIRFSGYRYGEDRIFNCGALRCSPSVKCIPDVLYNYNIDKGVSLISGYIPDKLDSCKIIFENFSGLCIDKDIPRYMFLKNILSCMTVLFAGNCTLTNKEKIAYIKNLINDTTVHEAMKKPFKGKTAEFIRRIIYSKNTVINFVFSKSVAACQKRLLPLFLKFRG